MKTESVLTWQNAFIAFLCIAAIGVLATGGLQAQFSPYDWQLIKSTSRIDVGSSLNMPNAVTSYQSTLTGYHIIPSYAPPTYKIDKAYIFTLKSNPTQNWVGIKSGGTYYDQYYQVGNINCIACSIRPSSGNELYAITGCLGAVAATNPDPTNYATYQECNGISVDYYIPKAYIQQNTCEQGDKRTVTCWDGSVITTQICTNYEFAATNIKCAAQPPTPPANTTPPATCVGQPTSCSSGQHITLGSNGCNTCIADTIPPATNQTNETGTPQPTSGAVQDLTWLYSVAGALIIIAVGLVIYSMLSKKGKKR